MGANGNTDKSHCMYGHEYTSENTIEWLRSNGQVFRKCRACKQKWDRNYRAKQKAQSRKGRKPRTHCLNGHLYSILPSGRKRCHECDKVQERRRSIKRQERLESSQYEIRALMDLGWSRDKAYRVLKFKDLERPALIPVHITPVPLKFKPESPGYIEALFRKQAESFRPMSVDQLVIRKASC